LSAVASEKRGESENRLRPFLQKRSEIKTYTFVHRSAVFVDMGVCTHCCVKSEEQPKAGERTEETEEQSPSPSWRRRRRRCPSTTLSLSLSLVDPLSLFLFPRAATEREENATLASARTLKKMKVQKQAARARAVPSSALGFLFERKKKVSSTLVRSSIDKNNSVPPPRAEKRWPILGTRARARPSRSCLCSR